MALPFISEENIDNVIGTLNISEKKFETILAEFKTAQPAILGYLFSDTFDLLTTYEKENFLFISLVIWKSISNASNEKLPIIGGNQIETTEDLNWGKIENIKAKNFQERVTYLFENYPQEDLLAFVEDFLVDDEDNEITKEGRMYIFVAAKTIIDCFV